MDEGIYVPMLKRLVRHQIEHIELTVLHASSSASLDDFPVNWSEFDSLLVQMRVQKLVFHLAGLSLSFELREQWIELTRGRFIGTDTKETRENEVKDMFRKLKALMPKFIAGGGRIHSTCGWYADGKYLTVDQ